jgi:hypothetical protein
VPRSTRLLSVDLHGCAGESGCADRAYEPVDRVVGEPNASVAAGGSERIDEACASPAVDPDCSVAAVELLQHVAVSGQLEYSAAEEIVRMPRYCPHNGEQADRGRGAGFPDDDAHGTNGCSCPKQGEGAVGRRDLDTPRVFSRTTSLALTHPVASLGRHGRRTRNQQRLSAARGRARISSHGTSVRASQREGCRRLSGRR